MDLPNYPPYCFIENDRTVGIPSLAAPMRAGRLQPPRPDGARLEARGHHAGTDAARRRLHREVGQDEPGQAVLPVLRRSPRRTTPWCPPAEFKGSSQAGEYGDFVAQVDWTVGQVLEALSRAGLADNTLVIFTSDNGPECVEIDPGAYDRVPATMATAAWTACAA